MGRHGGRWTIERLLLLSRLWSLLNSLWHVLLGELLLQHLLLMLEVHHRFLSFVGTHTSELGEVDGGNSGYLLTDICGERPRIHAVDRGGRFLEDLTRVHLGHVSHLLLLEAVREHWIGVHAVAHESCLNCLARSHHRAVGHRISSNAARVHKLASSVEHRRVGRLLNSIVRKL